MDKYELINKLSAVDSILNVIMADIAKCAPIVMDYTDKNRPNKNVDLPLSSIRSRFNKAKQILQLVMEQSQSVEKNEGNGWSKEDEHNLCQLVCLCNLWQDGGKETLLPKRAYEMRQWLRKEFPHAERYKRPLVPIENLTWEQWEEVKNDMCEG